jgi:hypothetical protein
MGGPQVHEHSLEKPGLEGSEKEGTRLLNSLRRQYGGKPGVSPLFLFAIIS